MYAILVFFHVISAIFLGVFLTFPIIIKRLFSQTGQELKTVITTFLSFTRGGHYALVLILITGGWMTMGYSTYPSTEWVIIATLLLALIGAMIGMINTLLKKILSSEQPEENLINNRAKLKWYGWCLFLFIIAASFIMTNRGLFA
ncbi:hypothetical protein NST02_02680 [Robertmurraya sp. FSL W8-0741]|uniref:hypothetical protein n=1 Tax=Robertmurraya sp. FSL W8-0741 TaxID=2954629 RepID=UPI0030F62CCD